MNLRTAAALLATLFVLTLPGWAPAGLYWVVQAKHKDEPFKWQNEISYIIFPGEGHPDALDHAREKLKEVAAEPDVLDARIIKEGELSAANAQNEPPYTPPAATAKLTPFVKLPRVDPGPYKYLDGYNSPLKTPDAKKDDSLTGTTWGGAYMFTSLGGGGKAQIWLKSDGKFEMRTGVGGNLTKGRYSKDADGSLEFIGEDGFKITLKTDGDKLVGERKSANGKVARWELEKDKAVEFGGID
jgi:hypothetical protein